jgi:di/tripeptidase
MSLGIPALCIGVYIGAKSHTSEEWVDLESLPTGLKIATELLLTYFE